MNQSEELSAVVIKENCKEESSEQPLESENISSTNENLNGYSTEANGENSENVNAKFSFGEPIITATVSCQKDQDCEKIEIGNDRISEQRLESKTSTSHEHISGHATEENPDNVNAEYSSPGPIITAPVVCLEDQDSEKIDDMISKQPLQSENLQTSSTKENVNGGSTEANGENSDNVNAEFSSGEPNITAPVLCQDDQDCEKVEIRDGLNDEPNSCLASEPSPKESFESCSTGEIVNENPMEALEKDNEGTLVTEDICTEGNTAVPVICQADERLGKEESDSSLTTPTTEDYVKEAMENFISKVYL